MESEGFHTEQIQISNATINVQLKVKKLHDFSV